MPVYEYVCNQCSNRFEDLVSLSSSVDEQPCPECASSDVERLLSSFAMHSVGSTPTVAVDGTHLPGPAGGGSGRSGCCGGGCGGCG